MAGDRVRTAGFRATPAAKTALRLGDHHDQGRAPVLFNQLAGGPNSWPCVPVQLKSAVNYTVTIDLADAPNLSV